MFTLHIFELLLVCHCFVVCSSSCLQNTFDSGTFNMCSDKCLNGATLHGCINPDNVLDKTGSISIFAQAPVWRRGAIQNLPELAYVSARQLGIVSINPGALLNLPKLKGIQLTYNYIEEVAYGVFSNSSLESIDLSQNLISYVENEAFSDMPNLKSLLLDHNKIKEIHRNWFVNSNALNTLRLSNNEIKTISSFTFSVFPDMEYLDLSFNQIKEIGGGAFNNIKALKRLDLTSNRLSWIATDIFKTKIDVEELRLSLNRFSFLSPIVLENGNVKSVSLHPNPWQCPCLDDISRWMFQHNLTLIDPSDDHRIKYNRNLPDCSFNPKSIDKCIVGYDDDFLKAQEIFFREVNYTESVWAIPTREKPDFGHVIVDKPLGEGLSPIS